MPIDLKSFNNFMALSLLLRKMLSVISISMRLGSMPLILSRLDKKSIYPESSNCLLEKLMATGLSFRPCSCHDAICSMTFLVIIRPIVIIRSDCSATGIKAEGEYELSFKRANAS